VKRGEDIDHSILHYPSSHVFTIQADSVNLTGFKITNAAGAGMAGVYAENRRFLNLSSIQLEHNSYGIYLYSSSNYNSISGNNVTGNGYCGIRLESSYLNVI
jgi:parallel beta-helix repeat protein